MRALRTLLIVVVILGGLFVGADRLAVHYAEGEVAERLRSTENLASTPEVSINGFPFLTQLIGGELDDTEIGIEGYQAVASGGERVRIDEIRAHFRGVTFSGDYSRATAASADGTALIAYDELLRAAKSRPTRLLPGATAKVVGLSDGGNGKVEVDVEVTALGRSTTYAVLSTVTVKGDTVRVHADNLPRLVIEVAEGRVRSITDFEQRVDGLPGGVELDAVRATPRGVEIAVRGSNVTLAG
jgi:hypothetical protein